MTVSATATSSTSSFSWLGVGAWYSSMVKRMIAIAAIAAESDDANDLTTAIHYLLVPSLTITEEYCCCDSFSRFVG